MALKKVPINECASRTGLEILFESESRLFVRKSEVCDQKPRAKFSGVRRPTLVMCLEPTAKVARRADVLFSWMRLRLQ